MKFNVFPNYTIPIEYIDINGNRTSVGRVATPDICLLKEDQKQNNKLVVK